MLKVRGRCYYMYNRTYLGEESSLLLLQSLFYEPLLFCSREEAESLTALRQRQELLSLQDLVHCPKIDVAEKTMKHQ